MALDILRGDVIWMRGKIRDHWPEITAPELSVWIGEVDMLIGKIQEHYGVTISEAQGQISQFLPELHDHA